MFTQVIEKTVGLSDDALDARIRELELERRRIEAELAASVAVADQRRLYGRDGHRSVSGYLRATINRSRVDIARLRSAAELVADHPALGDAWLHGDVSLAQVSEIARGRRRPGVNDRFDEFVPLLTDHARELPFADLQLCVERVVSRLDDDGTCRREADERRTAHLVEIDGTLDGRISGGGDPTVTAATLTVFDAFVEREYRLDLEAVRRSEPHGSDGSDGSGSRPPGVHLPRTAGQRRYDAFIAMARAAGAALDAGIPCGVGDWSPDLRIDVLFTAEHFAQMLSEHGLAPADLDGELRDATDLLDDPASVLDRRCETTTGIQLDPHDVLRSALDATVRRVVVDSAGVVVDLGRTQRLFSGSARAAATLLIRTCEHAGCEIPGDWCEVDHADEWHDDGGSTDQANARILCRWHNRWKHRSGFRVERGVDGRSCTVRPDGTIVLAVGQRPPPQSSHRRRRRRREPEPLTGEIIWAPICERIARSSGAASGGQLASRRRRSPTRSSADRPAAEAASTAASSASTTRRS
ncbi:MAG: DUF222 domain-containing protein [Actinomycetota bacterium]